MTIYVEYLSLRTVLAFVLKELFVDGIRNQKVKTHYYIDATTPGKTVANILGKLVGFQFERLNFELRHIKDERGELIRLRIHRKDLFEIQEQMIISEAFRALYKEEWKQLGVDDFIIKGLIESGSGIMDKMSASRTLFLIEVVKWHANNTNACKVKLLLMKRAWWHVFQRYAVGAGLSLKGTNHNKLFFFNKTIISEIIRKFPRLFLWLKSLKYRKFMTNPFETDPSIPKLYIWGRGDINLENNGHHSDFFWLLNSNFPERNVLCDFHSEKERLYLIRHGIHAITGQLAGISTYDEMKAPLPNKNRRFKKEFAIIKSLITHYNYYKFYWISLCQTYSAKVVLTWYKSDNSHMAIADAVKHVGGIFAIWQVSFEGHRSIDNTTNADIVFNFSRWSHNIEQQLGSKIKYEVITGYPRDYVAPLLRKAAMDLRKKLQSRGAKKIVFVIDENSGDDPRWHTGHSLQRENYSFILEKVLSTPWLGVVFKPKTAKTLRRRLGEVAHLLTEAEKTGRCYIYETSGRYTTIAPPLLAGLSADVCIHGHLGTGGLECALEGIPTLLIDREGGPENKLRELPKGKVIFENWPDTIDALMVHFRKPQGIPGFGDWSGIIDEFDPFKDGKAATRIGTYLHWLIQGFEQGLERDKIMVNAAERYCQQWGYDKIFTMP